MTGEIVGNGPETVRPHFHPERRLQQSRPAALALLDRGGSVLLEGFEAEADSRLWITAGKRPQLRDNIRC